jgi:ATP-dependent phosphoenolpyruvate carboxykinase
MNVFNLKEHELTVEEVHRSGYTAKVAGTEVGVKDAIGDIFSMFWRAISSLASQQVR